MGGAKWCLWRSVVVMVVVVADSQMEERRLVEMTNLTPVEMKKSEMDEVKKRRLVETIVEEGDETLEIKEEEMRKLRRKMEKEMEWRRKVAEMNKWRLVEVEEEEEMTEEEDEEEMIKRKKREIDTREQMEMKEKVEMKRRLVEEVEDKVEKNKQEKKENQTEVKKKQVEVKRRLVEMRRRPVEMTEEEKEEVEKVTEERETRKQVEEEQKQVEMKRRLVEMRRRPVEMTEEEKEEVEKITEETETRKQVEEEEKQVETKRRLVEMTEEEEVEKKEDITEETETRKQVETKRRLVEMTMEEEEDLPVLSIQPEEMSLVAGESYIIEISLSKNPAECLNVTFNLTNPLGTVAPSFVTVCAITTPSAPPTATLTTHTHGTTTLTAYATPEDLVEYPRSGGAFSVVMVMKKRAITTTADVLGWLYTIAWDASFLPQILHNWRRRSVIGLSLDFLTFNFIGFFSYFLYNMGLYWIPEIQDQYAIRYPQTILHVRLNDVIFPMYALVCVFLQILQCLFYKRAEGQRVSVPCRVVSGLLILTAVIGCILVPLVDDWWWLDQLYLFSYVKLAITCVKYVPQLYVNYKHRSTEGWSIYQVILDFTGGTLSLVQMFLLSANYDDWQSLLTDPSKLGLGLLSILFNILFFMQHYCLYRNAPSTERPLKGEEGPMSKLEAVPSPPSPTSPPSPQPSLQTAEARLSEGKGREGKEEEELREVVTGEEKKEEEEEKEKEEERL